jgi:hypothetical protein
VNIIRQVTHKQVRHCLQNDSIAAASVENQRTVDRLDTESQKSHARRRDCWRVAKDWWGLYGATDVKASIRVQ